MAKKKMTVKEIRKTIATQEQESIAEQKKNIRELDLKILAWNILYYGLSVLLILGLIQHAIFFYGWPIDMSRWVDIPVWMYFLYGFFVWGLLKLSHYIEEMGELFHEVPPVEEIEDQEVP
jgi:hypothetical protein